ncbi:MAG: 2-dehydropantoate 2-reductase [Oceanospirillaceae bacterium]|nr:2-dehydropantoate 2-reductase [Oceanospirillaceae bacterium]
MKIAMVGAGGIGCYYGARLQTAGHQVVYVARGAHLNAMQQHGLTVRHPDFQFRQPVEACDVDGLMQQHHCDDFDLIVIALKAAATRPVMEQLHDWLQAAQTPVMSIQNGVNNEAEIAHHLESGRILGGLAVRIGGHIEQPGVVDARGVAQIQTGVWPNASASEDLHRWLLPVVDAFNQAGIPTSRSDDIQRALWCKLMINNGVNPLSAITFLDTRQITSDPVLGNTVYQMMDEVRRAGLAAGVSLTREDVDAMFKLISEFDAIKTSMLVDREMGRPLELDEICGTVIRYCHDAGDPAQTTELVHRLLQSNLVASSQP